jgi:hypothetical protein
MRFVIRVVVQDLKAVGQVVADALKHVELAVEDRVGTERCGERLTGILKIINGLAY